ncbi:hypothetical protein M405DRAFT_935812 [Rhizopogon salebrosus TDB-379]|nr:hypothetical protein M405DRAFT_935812 [Rhizopogon salebrosus TDB-379]
MTWAARRQTTKVEDVAYSLIGIFDVDLPTSYGEGGERAFGRLVEAIMQCGDPSVLNWTGEPLLYKSSRDFPRSPQNFVGQTLQLPPIGERLKMTMTGRGLQLSLVILPLTSGDVPHAGWLTSRLRQTVKSEIYSRAAGFLTHRSYQFALGIVNYSIGSREIPWIWHRNLTGLILYRKPETPVGRGFPRAPSSGLKEVSPPKREFGPWKRVDGTRLVEVDSSDLSDQSVSYIDHKYLKTVYL